MTDHQTGYQQGMTRAAEIASTIARQLREGLIIRPDHLSSVADVVAHEINRQNPGHKFVDQQRG